jgi:hypothetical protein
MASPTILSFIFVKKRGYKEIISKPEEEVHGRVFLSGLHAMLLHPPLHLLLLQVVLAQFQHHEEEIVLRGRADFNGCWLIQGFDFDLGRAAFAFAVFSLAPEGFILYGFQL